MAADPKSTGLKSSEGKLAIGGLAVTLGPILMSAFSGENGVIDLTDMQKNILLCGAVAVAVAFILSRGMAKTESR